MTEPTPEMNNIPTWLQLFLATITGAIVGTSALVRWAFTIDRRMQRIENQDLTGMIVAILEKERHDKLYPLLHERVFIPLDKIEDAQQKQSIDIATLLERDRIGQRLEKVISALNAQAMKAPP